MNKTEQAEQLILAAELLKTGHPWECSVTNDKWIKNMENDCLLTALAFKREIRAILATPPDGRPLHNPDNLTAEQVGLGWRLIVKDEPPHEAAEVWAHIEEAWQPRNSMCVSKPYMCFNDSDFYRVPLSVPWPEAKPDPYAELKAAHAAGKVIQCVSTGRWLDLTSTPSWSSYYARELRIKPDAPSFQLPPPPPGMKWHREDGWKAEDLPQGYRPLVYNECRKNEDEWTYDDVWRLVANYGSEGEVGRGAAKHRTTRPLVFAHEGQEWTYHKPGDPMPCDGDMLVCLYRLGAEEDCDVSNKGKNWFWKDETIIGWRYAETTKLVELGPEDVPPLSVIRRKGEKQNWHWRLISYVHGTHAICADRAYEWSELERDYGINRSIPLTGKWDATAWEPCSKSV